VSLGRGTLGLNVYFTHEKRIFITFSKVRLGLKQDSRLELWNVFTNNVSLHYCFAFHGKSRPTHEKGPSLCCMIEMMAMQKTECIYHKSQAFYSAASGGKFPFFKQGCLIMFLSKECHRHLLTCSTAFGKAEFSE